MRSSRSTSLWTAAAAVTVAGALLTLPRADAGPASSVLSVSATCYKVRTLKGFKVNKTDVRFTDALRGWDATVAKPELYCVHTTINPVNATIRTESFTCFKVKEARGTPKLNVTDYEIQNLFGTQLVRLSKGKMVCVPNAFSAPLK